jgi:hypothetical protein
MNRVEFLVGLVISFHCHYHDGTKAHTDPNSMNAVLFSLGVKQPHFTNGQSLSSSIKLKNI